MWHCENLSCSYKCIFFLAHIGSEVHKPVRLNTFHVGMVVVFEYISPKTGDRIDLNFLHRSAPADGDKYVDKILFHMAIHGTSASEIILYLYNNAASYLDVSIIVFKPDSLANQGLI